jgi:hypothetical protein
LSQFYPPLAKVVFKSNTPGCPCQLNIFFIIELKLLRMSFDDFDKKSPDIFRAGRAQIELIC